MLARVHSHSTQHRHTVHNRSDELSSNKMALITSDCGTICSPITATPCTTGRTNSGLPG